MKIKFVETIIKVALSDIEGISPKLYKLLSEEFTDRGLDSLNTSELYNIAELEKEDNNEIYLELHELILELENYDEEGVLGVDFITKK